MPKAGKKTAPAMQFTTHTLWTAQCAKVQGESAEIKITKQLQDQLRKNLAASQGDLKQKLETFEAVEVPDAAAHCLIK